MLISLRSQMTAGTAALVGAAAIAMTPVTQPDIQLPELKIPSSAAVALAGFDNPLTELIQTLLVGDDFNYSFTDNLTYIDQDGYPNVLQYPDGDPYVSYVGMIPEFIYQALPIITNLGYNGSTNIGDALYALGSSAYIVSEGIWNLPQGLIEATQQLLSGQISEALTTLYDYTLQPLLVAAQTAITGLLAGPQNVLTNVFALVGEIPGLATQWVNEVVGITQALAQTTIGVVTTTLAALTSLNFEGAWNAVVDGTLGPGDASILGALVNLTVGPGYGYTDEGVAVPSLRFLGQSTISTIANAVSTPSGNTGYPVITEPLAAASAAAAPVAFKAASAAAVEAPSAPEADSAPEASAPEASSAAEADAPSAAPAAETPKPAGLSPRAGKRASAPAKSAAAADNSGGSDNSGASEGPGGSDSPGGGHSARAHSAAKSR